MAALAAPPPDNKQLIEEALGRALDAGKTGPELLSALHAAAPHLEMAAMHSLLEDYKAKEDAKLFDLVAENYRDFFRIATSVEGSAEDIVYTNLFTGVHGNYLRKSIVDAGLDPDDLPESDPSAMNFGSGGGSKSKAWKDIWGSGQGIGSVKAIKPAAEFIAQLAEEYEAAKARLCG